MRIEVCFAGPDGSTRIPVELDAPATAGDAVDRSDIVARLSLDPSRFTLAIYGRRATATTELHDGDRVEILRPLQVDPKEARHRRVAKKRAT